MASIGDILDRKGSHVHTIEPHATTLEAAERMNQHKIGCLVVVEEAHVRGVFTERDILQRIVAERRDSQATLVRDVMTTEVMCCRPDTSVDEARYVMKERRIRHLPVIDSDDRLVGLISIGDLNAHEVHSKETTIHLLHQYIYGHVGA
ncbi:MAG: CBS domain-containing protein [Gemmataceae bacterium]